MPLCFLEINLGQIVSFVIINVNINIDNINFSNNITTKDLCVKKGQVNYS